MAGETYQVAKVNALPALPTTPDTVYLVKSATSGFLDFYVSDSTGTSYRHTITRDEVMSAIASQLGAAQNSFIVADIAARNALAPTIVTMAYVIDASADPDVTAGSAQYIFNPANTTWLLVAEYESQIGPNISWSIIVGGPSSSVADIDDAVAKKHAHANIASLNRLGVDVNGIVTVDGAVIKTPLVQAQW